MAKVRRAERTRKALLDQDPSAFLAAHEHELPPEELAPIPRGRAPVERMSAERERPAPRPARVSRKDAPDFDDELGRIPEWNEPAAPNATREQAARWVHLATEVVARLGQLSAYRGHMPIARLPPMELDIDARTIAALPALEALHRALARDWRAILRDWFESQALARVEAKQRTIPSRQRTREGLPMPFVSPPREVPDGAGLLVRLHANPPELVGEIPAGLTAKVLDGLAQNTSRKASKGGWTPETAVELAELSATDPAAFAAEMRRRKIAKTKRHRRAETRK